MSELQFCNDHVRVIKMIIMLELCRDCYVYVRRAHRPTVSASNARTSPAPRGHTSCRRFPCTCVCPCADMQTCIKARDVQRAGGQMRHVAPAAVLEQARTPPRLNPPRLNPPRRAEKRPSQDSSIPASVRRGTSLARCARDPTPRRPVG